MLTEEQIDKLRSHPDITDIEMTDKQIIVTTKCIYIKYEGVKYKFGRFKIVFPLLPPTYIPYFINLDAKLTKDVTRNEGYGSQSCGRGNCYVAHSSIDPIPEKVFNEYSGNYELCVCLGNIGDVIHGLLCNKKYATAINIIIEFLKSHFEDNAHVPIKYFDVVE